MSIGYCPTCQAAPIIGDDYCPTCHRTGRTDAWVKSLPEYKPDAFGTRLSAEGVNRLGDTTAERPCSIRRETVKTPRMQKFTATNGADGRRCAKHWMRCALTQK